MTIWKMIGLEEDEWEALQRLADQEFGGTRQAAMRQAVREILIKHGIRAAPETAPRARSADVAKKLAGRA